MKVKTNQQERGRPHKSADAFYDYEAMKAMAIKQHGSVDQFSKTVDFALRTVIRVFDGHCGTLETFVRISRALGEHPCKFLMTPKQPKKKKVKKANGK